MKQQLPEKLEQIDPKELADNVFSLVGTEWMLVTAGTPAAFNTMTASWGGLGWLWNKPVAFVFIRPERYTYRFIEQSDTLSLSFLGTDPEARRVHQICGHKSGRDTDKVAEAGLTVLTLPTGGLTFAQSRLTLECRKLYAAPLEAAGFADRELLDRWYAEGNGMHKMYVCEITAAWR